MQIHVVQAGQSIFDIARLYNSTVSAIVGSNEVPNPNQLVVGQTLVIPIVGSYYWVQPGNSLYSIARSFGINYRRLAQVNGISPGTPLKVGLRLYIPPRPKRNAEINAYVEPIGGKVDPELEQSARSAAPFLTYLAPFSFRIQRNGTLEPPPLNNFAAIARANNASLIMVVTNIEEGKFSAELGRIILTNTEIQNRLLNNIIALAKQYNFRDIHFDMEFLPPELRENYNSFLRKAKARLSSQGLLMSTALAPKTSATQVGAWYEAHDYKAHGQISDFVVIMTYEWGYSGGPAMAVSPIGPVRNVLEYALTEIPASKIMMGQNLYGYDWTLPFVPGGKFAKAVSPQQAIELAVKYNVPIKYDYKAQAPHFNYTDEARRQHEVWFEDARSIQAKFNLVKELGLRGVSYWKLGLSFPQNWLLIENNFNVTKR
ncbi:spore gernimation protein [Clostridium carboxidivorans P7]|uniref:Glycoside hydrolase family 18 n=1 Tax=Clostridium carboxidivorans P7 TaxID=536227 RepID=C6PPM5_9CLOT|nr:glycoside hydrolase family 18 protein [Clostridium carboxidivorans]AKN30360.1 spore gernimation protein [Clostridium carboxidivorans P7]EET88755.1 glycoside hydrolase family 18 [Clostridium carboxidivorans P7]